MQPKILPSALSQQALRNGLWPALVFSIILAGISAAVINPLIIGLLHALVGFSGDGFQGNEALAGFVLSPLGLASILTIAILVLWHGLIELSGLVIVGHRSLHSAPIRQPQLWLRLIAKAPVIAQLSAVTIAMLAVIALPFAVIGLVTYFSLLTGADINYYLSARPAEFWAATGVFAVLAGTALILITILACRWILAVPLCMIEDRPAIAALRESTALTNGHRWRIFLYLMSWQICALLLAIVVAFMIGLLEDTVLAPERSLNGLVTSGVVLLIVIGVAGIAFRAVTGVTLGAMVIALYQRAAARDDNALSVANANLSYSASQPPRSLLMRIMIGSAIVLTVAAANVTMLVDLFAETKTIEVSAHRAGAMRGPENTIAALEIAIKEGAQFAEIDVQQTADGEVVVIHDTDLRRQTGMPRAIWEVTYDDIRDLDAGSWFSPAFAHARISTLKQFISAAKGRIRLNIELKKNGHNPHLVEAVIAVLRDTDYLREPVLTSLDLDYLKELRRQQPDLKIGYIVATGLGSLPAIDVDFYALSARLATPARIRTLEQGGRDVHVWTLNTRDDLVNAVLNGADNLITDDPILGLKVAAWYRDMSDIERLSVRLRKMLAGMDLFGG